MGIDDKESTQFDWVDSEEEERVNYETETYITDPDESARGDDAGGSSYIPDTEPKPKVGTTMTMAFPITRLFTKHLISIEESSDFDEDT
ncbi:uncharacterized protein A4U43_C06F14110 [Asparagus officinalis]|uniref:Uncharacterized protein n=1 Tax=Asparagus officinalis TaxID=4686 RepID=A0A5P1EQ94_ASPOF|nr:uncharacterized protein A4U43_C06F14110 [Asparagus officinalis]